MYAVEAEEYLRSLYFILFLVFYFIIEQYIRGFQWMLFGKVCGIHVYYINRPILFSVRTHQSSWGICPTDDQFDCSRKEITAQCMFHPNNIASFSCCSAILSKSLTAAYSQTTGNVWAHPPDPFSPHFAPTSFNWRSLLNKCFKGKCVWCDDELKAEVHP
jgi:hypothetical protein